MNKNETPDLGSTFNNNETPDLGSTFKWVARGFGCFWVVSAVLGILLTLTLIGLGVAAIIAIL